jgi:SAM-dependent methyltransferase
MRSIMKQRINPSIIDFNYFTCKNNLKLFNLLIKENPKTILDVGCGDKPFKKLFKSSKYVGVDFDSKSKADYIIDLNKEKLPFKDNSFDCVIMSETLEHIFNIEHVIIESKRVLKKEGYIFISSPFIFPEHGVPYDFYRYTKYFYFEKFKDMEVISFNGSNLLLSSPLIVLNISIFAHKSFFFPLIFLNNALILLLESFQKLLLILFKHKLLKYVLTSFPVSYGFIFKKR